MICMEVNVEYGREESKVNAVERAFKEYIM